MIGRRRKGNGEQYDETEACELVAYLWEARRGARDAVGTGEPGPTPGIQEIRILTLVADWCMRESLASVSRGPIRGRYVS